jgi:hypothetical protein
MESILDILQSPWPWWVAGPIIAFVMFLLLYFGNNFGLSANFRNMCSMLGGGKSCEFFEFDWRKQTWNLVFILGTALGGFIAANFLMPEVSIGISDATKADLVEFGMANAGDTILPENIFNFESLLTLKGIIIIVVGGFLVGFGTRYAGGCTSGHAISGLSDLQPASLLAVIGFFIGGLIMTWLIMPSLYTL